MGNVYTVSSFSLNVAHVNLNNLSNKINHINHFLNFHSIHMLGISETWLTPSMPDSYLHIPNFTLIRADSPENTRKHGVAIYISNKFKFRKIDCDLPNVLIIYISEFDM